MIEVIIRVLLPIVMALSITTRTEQELLDSIAAITGLEVVPMDYIIIVNERLGRPFAANGIIYTPSLDDAVVRHELVHILLENTEIRSGTINYEEAVAEYIARDVGEHEAHADRLRYYWLTPLVCEDAPVHCENSHCNNPWYAHQVWRLVILQEMLKSTVITKDQFDGEHPGFNEAKGAMLKKAC